jgi:Tfp pilus assembly protein PilN
MHSEYGLSDRAQHILQEFERTLRFHESNYPDLALSKDTPLFLTGKLAGEADLSKAILAGTGFNAKPLASPLQFPPDLPLAEYAVNVGLALKAPSAKHSARKDRFLITDIDILPQVYLPSRLSTKQALSVFGIIIGIALIIPLYRIGDSAAVEVRQLRNENSMLQQSFSLRQSQIKETGQIQQAIDSVESTKQKLMGILQNLQQIGDQRQRAYDSLCLSVSHPPEGILPDGAKLSSISQESGNLNLIGEAPNYDTALEYADALRHTEGFSNVQVHSLASAGSAGTTVSFNISLDWE